MEVNPYRRMDINGKKLLLKNINKSIEDLNEAVKELKIWAEEQKHFPEVPSDAIIEFFLTLNDFDLELSKEKIDYYYTIKNEMPEVFASANPNSPSMIDTLKMTQIIPLPKFVDNSDGIIVVRIKNSFIPDGFNANMWLAAIINILEVNIQESLILQNHVIYDHEHLSLAHVLTITPSFIMNCATILEKLFSEKVRYIHVINYPSVFYIILKLCKPLLKPEIYDKFRLHDSAESLAEYIPLSVLPKDYGGEEKSLVELEHLWIRKLVEFKDRFDVLDTLKVNESLRENPVHKEQEGLVETFTKLFFT